MRTTIGLLALWLAASGAAFAQVQTPTQPPPARPADPNAAPPDKYGAPIDPRPKSSDGAAAPLGDDLSKSGGVVHPTGRVDPGMTQPPPDPGPRSTPVIKPPPSNDVKPQ